MQERVEIMASIGIPVQINGLELAESVIREVIDEYDFDEAISSDDAFSEGFRCGFQTFAVATISALRAMRKEGEKHG